MKRFLVMLLLSLAILACVSTCYHDDIEDIQAYTRKTLVPGLRGPGEDLAP